MNTQFTQEDYDELYRFGCEAFVKYPHSNIDFLKKYNYSIDDMIKSSVEKFLDTENINTILEYINAFDLDMDYFNGKYKLEDDSDDILLLFKDIFLDDDEGVYLTTQVIVGYLNIQDYDNIYTISDIIEPFFKLNVFKKIFLMNKKDKSLNFSFNEETKKLHIYNSSATKFEITYNETTYNLLKNIDFLAKKDLMILGKICKLKNISKLKKEELINLIKDIIVFE